MLFGSQIVRIGCESHIIHRASLIIHTMTAMMDTLSEQDTDSSCSHTRPHILSLTFNQFDYLHCTSRVSNSAGSTTDSISGMASKCI